MLMGGLHAHYSLHLDFNVYVEKCLHTNTSVYIAGQSVYLTNVYLMISNTENYCVLRYRLSK